MSSIGSVRPRNAVRPESCIRAVDNRVTNEESRGAPKTQDVSARAPTNEPTIVKNGLLWQKRDKFFSRWKERFFVLTKDYLACFKKESMIGTTKIGRFLSKVNLVDVEGVQWGDKKRHGLIILRLGTKNQVLLRTSCDLYGWMIALRDTINRSKKCAEATRNQQMIGQDLCDAGLPERQSFPRQHNPTSSDSQHHSSRRYAVTTSKLAPLDIGAPAPSSVTTAAGPGGNRTAGHTACTASHRASERSHSRKPGTSSVKTSGSGIRHRRHSRQKH